MRRIASSFLALFGPSPNEVEQALARSDGERLCAHSWVSPDGRVILAASADVGESPERVGFGRTPIAPVVVVAGRLEGGGSASRRVAEAYQEHGVDGLCRWRGGSYAFALWDPVGDKLVLGCDALGFCAPAYAWNGTRFIAGSSALAVVHVAGVCTRRWDPTFLAHGLSGVLCPSATATAFAGVRRMRAGELLRFSPGFGLEQLRGDRLRFGRFDGGATVAASEVGRRLDAVIVAGFDRGSSCLALSGGVDSSVVASALERIHGTFDAFTSVSYRIGIAEGPGSTDFMSQLQAQFPLARLHAVEVPLAEGTERQQTRTDDLDTDDFLNAAPAFQAARVALFRAIRDHGFSTVFDGEGGDELFDMAWRLGDLVRQGALGPLARVGRSRSRVRALTRDLLMSGSFGFASKMARERLRQRFRLVRPWLAESFWAGNAFREAWDDALFFQGLDRPSRRIPEILAPFARYWRIQDAARRSSGLRGVSPLFDRSIVELVGSLRAHAALDPDRPKSLLRSLLSRRVVDAVKSGPKRDSLSEALARRFVTSPWRCEEVVSAIRESSALTEFVDPNRVREFVRRVRDNPGQVRLASSLAHLFEMALWIRRIEAAYGVH